MFYTLKDFLDWDDESSYSNTSFTGYFAKVGVKLNESSVKCPPVNLLHITSWPINLTVTDNGFDITKSQK